MSIIVRQRFKERMNNNKPRRKYKAGVFNLKSPMAVRKIFKFFRSMTEKTDPVTGSHNVVAIDAAMKYKELAEKRAKVARSAFQIAALELRRAERGLEDAEKYLQSVHTVCTDKGWSENHDFILIEQQKTSEGITREVAISTVTAGNDGNTDEK
ncbi:hypothetical protein ACHAXS_002304 [Conticribra weissflogii]